jgi:hypothetical protein
MRGESCKSLVGKRPIHLGNLVAQHATDLNVLQLEVPTSQSSHILYHTDPAAPSIGKLISGRMGWSMVLRLCPARTILEHLQCIFKAVVLIVVGRTRVLNEMLARGQHLDLTREVWLCRGRQM